MKVAYTTTEDASASVSVAHLTEVKVAYVRTPCSKHPEVLW
jgi:hypothetical protein